MQYTPTILPPSEAQDSCAGYHKLPDDSCVEVFWSDDEPDNFEPGWYWWACQPGYLPDGEHSGPFLTSYLALADADEATAMKVSMEAAMGPRKNPLQPIFRDHNCWACQDGAKPCREGNYNCCSYPHARND